MAIAAIDRIPAVTAAPNSFRRSDSFRWARPTTRPLRISEFQGGCDLPPKTGSRRNIGNQAHWTCWHLGASSMRLDADVGLPELQDQQPDYDILCLHGADQAAITALKTSR